MVVLAAPKADMRLNEPWIKITRDDPNSGIAITLVYPAADSAFVECNVSSFDAQSWRGILWNAALLDPMPLSTFLLRIPTPPGALEYAAQPPTSVAQMRCAAIRSLMPSTATPAPMPPPAVPPVYIIVAPIAGQTSRPLYDANFATIGRVEFLLNGLPRVCEPTPIVYKTGSTVKYYWVTNNANQRGLAVCKPN
jgi:hypothetical protein